MASGSNVVGYHHGGRLFMANGRGRRINMLHARPDYQPRIQDSAGLIPDEEPVFILRAQDKTASAVVRFWAALNVNGDPIAVQMAQDHADKMDAWPKKKTADVPHNVRQVAETIVQKL